MQEQLGKNQNRWKGFIQLEIRPARRAWRQPPKGGLFLTGFTLVEAIVVIGIMVILTAILLGYSRNSEKQIIFFKEESLLIGSILRAKGFAIETFQPEINPGVSLPSRIICGWGVNFDRINNKYTVFADLAPPGGGPQNPCQDILGNPLASVGIYNSVGETFDVFELNSDIIAISCLSLNPNPTSPGTNCTGPGPSSLDITFIPPDPQVSFQPTPTAKEAMIKLRLSDGSRCSIIKVNTGGRIEVDPTVTC